MSAHNASLPLCVLLLGMSTLAASEVWACPEGYKIDKTGQKIFTQDPAVRLDDVKQKNTVWDKAAKKVTLYAARGETAAFQVNVAGGADGLANVDVALSDLTLSASDAAALGKNPGVRTIPAKQANLFKIYYTRLVGKGSGPTNRPSMGEGWYPDALVPWSVKDTTSYGGYDGPPFAIAANEMQGVWVDLEVPYGTPSGTYDGVVTVSVGTVKTELKVALTVYGFDLPRTSHNLFFMNFGIENLNQAGGYWLQGDKLMNYEDEVFRIARKHRFTAGNMYDGDRPKIVESANGLEKVDWTDYDKRWGKVLDPKNNIFGPGEPPIEIWKVPLFAILGGPWPVAPKAWDQMGLEIKKHWKEKGWDLSKAYAYLADEPGKEVADQLNDYAKRVKALPGEPLHRQIAIYTMLGNQWSTQQWVFDLWKDNLDMWMVAGDYYQPATMNALPKGCLKGMYQGAEPYQGNETLDSDGVAMRSWSWISWQYRIDYQCYYSMDEAWRGFENGKKVDNNNCEIWDSRPRTRPWGISQGVFIYPGRRVDIDLPIVNIRMKQIRRGQTDYEYFWLLKNVGEGAFADELCKGVIRQALAEAAPAPEQYEAGKWSHNPADWDAAILKAGQKLSSLAAKLPKEPAR